MKFNLIDKDYSDKVKAGTIWFIAIICVALSLALLMDRKYLMNIPFALFTISILPPVSRKIKLNRIILNIVRILLLGLTFYSIKLYI